MADYNLGTARGTIELAYKPGGADKAKEDLDGISKKGMSADKALSGVSRTAGITGTILAAGLGVAVKSAAGFEQRLSAIEAVSGATADQMSAISDKALQLGKDTAFSASESAQAMEELVKAGLTVEDVLNGAADATVNLAAAGEIDMPQAATIASNAMNQFNLAAEDMPKIADKIAGAANASAIDVSDFGMSLSQVGAVANLAGLSFEDTAVAIAEMGNAGIKGSDAGTSLKSMLTRLQPTTEKQAKLMKELGLITKDGSNAFYDQEGKLKGLADIQGTLGTALKGMSQEQKQAALNTIFGSDAIRAAAILADEGTDGYNKMADAMGKVSAADVAATKMDNLSGKVEALKGSVETVAIQLGTILIPIITTLVEKLSGAVDWFTELDATQQKIIVGVLAAAAGFLLVVAAMIKFYQFAKAAKAAYVGLKTAMLASKYLGPVAKGFKAVAGAVRLFTISLLTNPVFLIIAAIVALVVALVLLYKKNETVRNFINKAWAAIKAAIGSVVDWLVGTAWPAIQAVWDGIVTGAQAVWNGIKAGLGALKAAWDAVWGTFGPLVTAIFGLILAVIQLNWAIIKLVVMTAVAVISAVITAAWNFIKTVTSAVWNGIVAVIRAVWGVLKSIIGPPLGVIKSLIVGAWNGIKSVTSSVWNGLKSIVSSAIDGVVTLAKGIKDKVLSPFKNAATWLKDAGKKIIEGLIGGITSMIDKATGAVKKVTGAIGKFIPGSPVREGPLKVINNGHSGGQIVKMLADGIEGEEKTALLAVARLSRNMEAEINPTLQGSVDMAAAVPSVDSLRYSSDKAAEKAAAGQMIFGELDLTSRSTATVKGMASEVYDDEQKFKDTIERMGDKVETV